MTRYAKRRDENEPEIVRALENAGCDVVRTDEIDLVVGLGKKSYCLEVKRPGMATKSRLRPIQKRLRTRWNGHYAIVTTPEEALRAVGLWV